MGPCDGISRCVVAVMLEVLAGDVKLCVRACGLCVTVIMVVCFREFLLGWRQCWTASAGAESVGYRTALGAMLLYSSSRRTIPAGYFFSAAGLWNEERTVGRLHRTVVNRPFSFHRFPATPVGAVVRLYNAYSRRYCSIRLTPLKWLLDCRFLTLCSEYFEAARFENGSFRLSTRCRQL